MLERPNQVLVIDDDEAAREILVELLDRIGYHAFPAPDGNAGLEWLAGAARSPQAVLLDLRMPGLDGFEVLRRYRAEGGSAPVIALSAMDDKESVVKAMRLGASDYLVKPIEPEELREAIERCSLGSHPLPAGVLPPANQGARPASPVHVVPPAPIVPVGAETLSLKEIARQAALRAEREAISAMLARTNWNKRKAAARLQISYKALLYKIKDCGLTDPRITASSPQNLGPLGLVADGSSIA